MSEVSELESARESKEQGILRQSAEAGGGEIFSTIAEYTPTLGYLSEEELIADIEGKKVLDLGSSLGGLAKDVARRKIDCQVYSLEPRLSMGGARNEEKAATQEYLEQVTPKTSKLGKLVKRLKGIPEDDHREMQESHDRGATAAFAHALPFQDNSFDLILDKEAVSKHATRQDYDYVDKTTAGEKELFRTSLEEMVRVLKPGGRIRISDLFGYGWKDSWKEQIMDEMGLDYILLEEDLTNKQIYPNLWGKSRTIGVEITKH
jgi:SAM-dependent methyltransferase